MRRIHPMPFGAEPLASGGTRFRLWAPAARDVALCVNEAEPVPMQQRADGWFEFEAAEIGAGTRYRFALDGGMRVPDPASRFQPDDVHGASEVIDPRGFDWPDAEWRGRPWDEIVLYEIHVGAFTPEGTYAGVASRLDTLVELGVTAIELMPLSDFPGRRNWGYDGVCPFAPDASYGRPDDLKALVAAAHARGLCVFLDVVYNHFGPEGNYLHLTAPQFFTERYQTPWGAAIAFDGGAAQVRQFFIENALYWVEEFNVDGLRFDAVHAIFDTSPKHILFELGEAVRARVPQDRHVHLVLENGNNEARFLARGCGYEAQWNDDYHHAAHVTATGEAEGYYEPFSHAPVEDLGRALTQGFVRERPGLAPSAFVSFLQNHDQIGNRAFGERLDALIGPEVVEALLAVTLLAPSPPMLFMGEEWAATEPFPFFCDFGDELADAVREGRRREFAKFAAFRDEAARARIPDPNAETTFRAATLDWARRDGATGRTRRELVQRLLSIRRLAILPRLAGTTADGAGFRLHGARGLDAWWRLGTGETLRVIANLGPEQPTPPPARPTGGAIFATHPSGASWAAWSVSWFIGP
jgi:malto-oligosyltrehalose trehalohydrolase